ncbi:hypothetical protein [Nannocystis pusilla]|uniref:hypothetical protein n=1 Tax=Nannocystis pusilla TaxID=889268 RepID=UPI003B7B5162
MLDSDFSEGEMLDDEDQRAVAVDVIGPHGSPDMGFEIQSPSTSVYDFSILSGSYYLGGMRHEIVGTTVTTDATATAAGTSFTAPQRFRAQTDWLQATRRDEFPCRRRCRPTRAATSCTWSGGSRRSRPSRTASSTRWRSAARTPPPGSGAAIACTSTRTSPRGATKPSRSWWNRWSPAATASTGRITS